MLDDLICPLSVSVVVDNTRLVHINDMWTISKQFVSVKDVMDFIKPQYLLIILLKDEEYRCRKIRDKWKCEKRKRW